MDSSRDNLLLDAVLVLARAAELVSAYCDRAEHTEPADPDDVRKAGHELCVLAVTLARERCNEDLFDRYAQRLDAIERRNVLHGATGFEGATAARGAATWRDLQIVQAQHDRAFHPDVAGMSRYEQLRHDAFHLAKLAGAFARGVAGDAHDAELYGQRLPDILLFGIKLATTVHERLPDDPLPRWAA